MADVLTWQKYGVSTDTVATDHARHLVNTVDLSSATWNTAATHEVFTVDGLVRVRMWIECTETVVGAGSIQFGHETASNGFIASTTGTDLATNDIWYDTSPATVLDTYTNAVMDYVINGNDIGYEITGAALTDGTLAFHCVWDALNATGSVVLGSGGVLA